MRKKKIVMINKGKKCIFPGCNNNARCKNYCINCYSRVHKRNGMVKTDILNNT